MKIWDRSLLRRLCRLQWKLTLSYALGSMAALLILEIIELKRLLQTRQALAKLEERNRLACDRYDSVKQWVFATAMQVGAAEALLSRNPTAAQVHLVEARRLVHQAQQELTALIQELRPAGPDDTGRAQTGLN